MLLAMHWMSRFNYTKIFHHHPYARHKEPHGTAVDRPHSHQRGVRAMPAHSPKKYIRQSLQNNIFANFTAQFETTDKRLMVYRFTIISDEVDDFVREIQIDSEATFYDLHTAILKSVKYDDNQMTSFFICDDNWERETEVTLEDMGTSSEEDCWVMSETKLDELLEDEKQKMVYVFDPLSERVFFIELTEIITGKKLMEPLCTRQQGKAPKQTLDYDDVAKIDQSMDLDENFYGDEDFDSEDFDPESFTMDGENNFEEEK